MDILDITYKLREAKRACEFLYGDRWPSIREKVQAKLKDHQEKNKTNNLLSSAIALSKDEPDARVQLVYLGGSL